MIKLVGICTSVVWVTSFSSKCFPFLVYICHKLYKIKSCAFHFVTRTRVFYILYWVLYYFSDVFAIGIDTCGIKPEGDSGSYGSVGSPVGGPECRSDYDGLQAQCDQAMHQLQLLRHKHSDTIRRFVLILFYGLAICILSFSLGVPFSSLFYFNTFSIVRSHFTFLFYA